ncbi:leucine-rich repeat-containing protein 49 [Venturia canescens]|uniref:leucine-rich repeat-containing protein 49 n=1 Tax=Venturia canescens TaxID=32260 RepID=UPI001C9D2BC7|nr:leucine-rich repeat-containing protein 49 [Venturia canescens]
MPISSNTKSQGKKLVFNVRGKSATVHCEPDQEDNKFFTIAPALPVLPGAPVPSKLTKRSYNSSNSSGSTFNFEDAEVGGCDVVALQQAGEGRTVVATRTSAEREKNPDRICLDRRGLTCFPEIISEPKLRLMSLQHNLISKIEGDHFAQLTKLVFLDLYDNQIEKICDLGTLENLRVLLVGKNRIKKIEGLKPLVKLEVLDLHGNQIVQISGLEQLESLKVLNLAGNNVKNVGFNDFQGLTSLRELNLKRNKIKKLLGFGETPQLQKLYLSNNDIQKIEDMGSLAKALQIREVSIDGNPVTLNADCVSFLVSYLPNLQVLSTMQVNEQVRRAAMAWRTTKEQSNSAFLDLSAQVCVNVRREEVITNAKTNWELLRSQTKCFSGNGHKTSNIKSERLRGLHLQNTSKFDTVKLVKGLNDTKSKGFGSLTAINENVEARKIQFKKRSNSSDGLFRLENVNRVNALNFKLPPILVPIINNLTNARINENLRNPRSNALLIDSTETTTDSDLESSESHESLKTGLRNHLIKTNNVRALSIDNEKNDLYNICNSMVGPTLTLLKKLENENRTTNERNSKSFLSPEIPSNNGKRSPVGQSSFTDTKSFFLTHELNETATKNNPNCGKTEFHLSSFNNSSLDSNKSIFGDSSSSSTTKADDLYDSEDEKTRIRSAQIKKMVHYKSNRAATARAKHRAVATPTPPPQLIPPKEKEQGGDYLVEIVGRCLNVYGQGALRFIDRPWEPTKATDVNIVKFNYVQFNGIAMVLSKLKSRFPNAEHFIFKETNISHLGQLNALAEVQGLTSIQIEPEGNPIIAKDWRTYTIFRLAHWGLKVINGREISERDIELANEEYSGLTDIVMWSLPESLLQPLLQRLHLEKAQKLNGEQITAKQFLFSSDPALRNVVAKEALQLRRGNVTQEDLISRHKGKVHLSNMIDQTIDAVQKLQILEQEWPNILYEIIRDTLIDYNEMNLYMKNCSKILEVDK